MVGEMTTCVSWNIKTILNECTDLAKEVCRWDVTSTNWLLFTAHEQIWIWGKELKAKRNCSVFRQNLEEILGAICLKGKMFSK